jgi:ceramide glucosyltransferase
VSALIAVAFILAGAGLVYLALATVMVFRLAGRAAPLPVTWPPVSVLKPLHGDEPGLFDNLASFVRQDYPGDVQVVLGVQRPDDPAIAVAEALVSAFPDRDIELVVDGRHHGENRKVSNLANLAERARHDVLVIADSDMRVAPDYLKAVIAELSRPGIGVATCAYHGLPIEDPHARLVGLGIDTHFLPGVAMSVGLGVGHPCLGSTIALRRETMAAIGGFHALADDLADDHEIGRRVRALGLGLAMAPFTIGHVCAQTNFGALLAQELRWARTIRQIEPWGHLGAVTTHPLPFALLAAMLAPGPLAIGFVLAAVLARFGLCLAAEGAFGLKPHRYWLLPARDLLSFFVYAASFLGRSVSWRGRRFDVARDGALLPKGRVAPDEA